VKLGYEELQELILEIQNKISEEITLANRTEGLEEILNKYGFNIEEVYYPYTEISRAKILLIGYSEVSTNDIYGICKSFNLDKNDIEIFDDYSKLPNFKCEILRYSDKYSDLLIGPLPHKMSGIGNHSSLISMIEDCPYEFPKLIKLDYTGELKITKESLKRALAKTLKYKEKNQI